MKKFLKNKFVIISIIVVFSIIYIWNSKTIKKNNSKNSEEIISENFEEDKEEVDKDDEETGRAVVEVVLPYTYGSEKKGTQVIRAIKMNFVAGSYVDDEGEFNLGADLLEYGADEILDCSCLFIGELNSYYVDDEPAEVVEDNKPRRGFGKSARRVTNTKRTTKSEFLLTGVDVIGDGDAFPEDDIRDALQARNKDIEEKKRNEEEKVKKEESGVARGRGSMFGGTAANKEEGQAPAGGARPSGRQRRGF